ncbi:nuclear transport factor 2 family protein [Sphingobacterium sp. 18053]|uniref:nuclear transport factor 2 family protein n=1 Tax=Sphingobacterium sp. 18053 TaxID=2681401 RepID=UPI0013589AA6|nr:nuclear transport factor 2 family protein [Sphingobacterium sp. 18053]
MNGEKTMELRDIEEFKNQAIDALSYFSERERSIEAINHIQSSIEIIINYKAIAAIDFHNGLKKVDEINLQGKSIFEFSDDGKIVKSTNMT